MKVRFTLAVVVIVVLGCPAGAQATFPGANGKLAFVRDNDIWTMNPDGSNQVNITNTPLPASEASPSWSADGKQITYSRERAIWKMNGDGTLQTQVLAAPPLGACGFPDDSYGSPQLSPDGSKIVFSFFHCRRDVEGGELDFSDLYTVNPDGSGKTLLHTEGLGPRWSPDGTKIGYTLFCSGGGCTDVQWTTPDGSTDFRVYESDLS